MMEKDDSIYNLRITNLELKLWSSSENMNESLMVYLLIVRGANHGIKSFTSLIYECYCNDVQFE